MVVSHSVYFESFKFFLPPASLDRIRLVKQNLESCKNLLHCKRDELRKLWLEGVEQKTVVALLDQM